MGETRLPVGDRFDGPQVFSAGFLGGLVIATLISLLIFFTFNGLQSKPDPREQYYRGFYDTCIQVLAAEGSSFEIAQVACNHAVVKHEQQAWFESTSQGFSFTPVPPFTPTPQPTP